VLSFRYFQALMEMDIIMTPQTQDGDVLALPDFYHELAHFVVFRQRSILEIRLFGLIHKFFANSLRRGRQQGLQEASLKSMADNYTLWSPRATRLRPFGVGRRTGGRTSG